MQNKSTFATKRLNLGGLESKAGSSRLKSSSGRLAHRDITDNQMAAINLKKALDYYDLTQDRRQDLKNELVELDSIKHMNMKYLAGALYILENIPKGENVVAQYLDESFQPMLRVLMNITSETGKDSPEQIIKHKEVLLTYMIKVIMFRGDEISHYTTEDLPERDEALESHQFEEEVPRNPLEHEREILEEAAAVAEATLPIPNS